LAALLQMHESAAGEMAAASKTIRRRTGMANSARI
jgi:hypothetical protein